MTRAERSKDYQHNHAQMKADHTTNELVDGKGHDEAVQDSHSHDPRNLDNIRVIGVRTAFHTLYFQVMDQAKAAYKNQYPLCEDGFYCILLVGPYWTVEKFGPFTEAELSVRALKKSDSGDQEATARLTKSMEKLRELSQLYIFNSEESYNRLEEILISTDEAAQPYITAMSKPVSNW